MSANLDTTQFVCILASSSLNEPKANRLNPNKKAAFFAQIAMPPEAGATLKAVMDAGLMQKFNTIPPGIDYRIKQNQQLAKPIAGIPADWFVVRSETQFAPYLADLTGMQIAHAGANEQETAALLHRIRSEFYPGRKVRVDVSAYGWTAPVTNVRGVSLNLNGVMLAGDGERLNIGQGAVVNAFQQHAQPAAQQPAANANPFANGATQAQQQTPMQQVQQAANANPFMQSAGGFSQ